MFQWCESWNAGETPATSLRSRASQSGTSKETYVRVCRYAGGGTDSYASVLNGVLRGLGSTAAAVLAAAVLAGCQGGSPEDRAIENASQDLQARADEIIQDAERLLVDRALGDKDPTTGMGTTYPELVDVPSRDPLTWLFYLHEVGTGGGWMETTDVQVGGCLQIVDDGADPESTAVRCPMSAPETRKKYFDVEIDVLTGEPW